MGNFFFILNGGEKLNEKRNPSINRGDGETSESYLGRLREYISKLEWQSEGHRLWYTHKNPYGCWICELLQVSRELETLYMDRRGDEGDSLDENDSELEEEYELEDKYS